MNRCSVPIHESLTSKQEINIYKFSFEEEAIAISRKLKQESLKNWRRKSQRRWWDFRALARSVQGEETAMELIVKIKKKSENLKMSMPDWRTFGLETEEEGKKITEEILPWQRSNIDPGPREKAWDTRDESKGSVFLIITIVCLRQWSFTVWSKKYSRQNVSDFQSSNSMQKFQRQLSDRSPSLNLRWSGGLL